MKKSIYILVLFLIVFNCSKSDDNTSNESCFYYSIFISGNCDCNYYDFNCGEMKMISEEEFIRLSDIQENSTEPCVYITGKEIFYEEIFEGYLIELTKTPCFEW